MNDSLFLLHVNASLARTENTLFEHITSINDLTQSARLSAFGKRHLEHGFVNIGIKCFADSTVLEISKNSNEMKLNEIE